MSANRAVPAAGLTDTGLTRGGNEDALVIEAPLYAVADGMGGHRAGEIASRVALEELVARAPARADAKALGRAVRAANAAVITAADKSRTRTGMGTTLTAAMVDGTRIAVAHVGDSRVYLLHEGVLQRLTQDHSMVADLIRQGSLTEEEARFHPQRSVITRALGSDPNMEADAFEADAAVGDRLLLCTDGLTGMLADDYIAEILRGQSDPALAVRFLVDAANRAGGYDNITAIVVDITGEAAADYGSKAGTSSSQRRRTAPLLWVISALVLVVAAAWGTWAYSQSQAYLIDENGVVAVYQGVPGEFLGLTLHWRLRTTQIPVAQLEPTLAQRLGTGIRMTGVGAALERALDMQRSLNPSATPEATATPVGP